MSITEIVSVLQLRRQRESVAERTASMARQTLNQALETLNATKATLARVRTQMQRKQLRIEALLKRTCLTIERLERIQFVSARVMADVATATEEVRFAEQSLQCAKEAMTTAHEQWKYRQRERMKAEEQLKQMVCVQRREFERRVALEAEERFSRGG